VGYAGQTVPVIERLTGEARAAHIFVAVLGASHSHLCRGHLDRGPARLDWRPCAGLCLLWRGLPCSWSRITCVSFVRKAEAHEPDLNPTYQDLCAHYGVAVIPARIRGPRDKAKVEVGVQVVERWILARLRHAQFFSLPELNATLRRLLGDLNDRPFKKLPGRRAHAVRESRPPGAESVTGRALRVRRVEAGARAHRLFPSRSTSTITACPMRW
jgi:transposase